MIFELNSLTVLLIAKAIFSVTGAVLFLQSGFDKISDRKGNLEWLKGHFAATIFKAVVPQLLSILTFLEISAGLACAVGLIGLFMESLNDCYAWGQVLCSFSLVALFTGQRIAKDYAGAASLIPYLLFFVLGILILLF